MALFCCCLTTPPDTEIHNGSGDSKMHWETRLPRPDRWTKLGKQSQYNRTVTWTQPRLPWWRRCCQDSADQNLFHTPSFAAHCKGLAQLFQPGCKCHHRLTSPHCRTMWSVFHPSTHKSAHLLILSSYILNNCMDAGHGDKLWTEVYFLPAFTDFMHVTSP